MEDLNKRLRIQKLLKTKQEWLVEEGRQGLANATKAAEVAEKAVVSAKERTDALNDRIRKSLASGEAIDVYEQARLREQYTAHEKEVQKMLKQQEYANKRLEQSSSELISRISYSSALDKVIGRQEKTIRLEGEKRNGKELDELWLLRRKK